MFRIVSLVIVLGCGGGTRSPAEHCETRQAFHERAYGRDTSAELFVRGCTRELGKTESASELACRDRCLDAADRSAPLLSDAAKGAYREFQSCEARCLGVPDGPQPVKAP